MRVASGWLTAVLATGCVSVQSPAPRAAPADAGVVAAPAPPLPMPPAPEEEELLYPLDEALADVLSGPLVHIGSGPWHGIFRILACAYRNERVIVVNVYCTAKETRAFRVDVFSPTRGRARIYAEGKVAISTITRAEYFTFKAEVEPAPPANAVTPPFSLHMTFAQLQAYEEKRYEAFLPACYGGVEIHKPQSGCLGVLAPHAGEWSARNRDFLERPPADWYRLIRELRARAASDAR